MPSVGDVIVRFLGDTTQIDQTLDRVTTGVTDLNAKAATSTVELKAAQNDLKTAFAAVTAEGGNTQANMNALAEAEERLAAAAVTSKEAHAALRAQFQEVAQEEGILAEVSSEVTGELGNMFALFAFAEGIKTFIEHTQQSVLELEMLHEKTGINITTLAGIEHVAEGAGVKFESVSTALTRLSRAQALAIEGNKSQVAAFERVGISIDQLKQLQPDELFFKVGQALAETKNHAEANASAFQFLGRGGAALIPIFRQNGEELRNMVDEAGRASGVTKEAGQAAIEWERAEARFAETTRALAIPVMQNLVPVMKAVENAGIVVANGWRVIASAIGGVALAAFGTLSKTVAVSNDLIHGNIQKAVADVKAGGEQVRSDIGGILVQWKQIHEDADKAIADIWKKQKPLQDAKDDYSDLADKSKDTTSELIAQAKANENAQVAAAEGVKKANQLAYDQGKINAKTWAEIDVQATMAVNKAHEDYYVKTIEIYTNAGKAQKAAVAAKELETQQQKNINSLLDQTDKTIKSLAEEQKKFQKASQDAMKPFLQDTEKALTVSEQLDKDWQKFIPDWVVKAHKLAEALKAVGVEGLDQMRQKISAAERAEKLLNDNGLKGGKQWLEVQKAKLQAIVAIAQAEGRSATQEIRQLHAIEAELKKFDREQKNVALTAKEVWAANREAIDTFKDAALSAFQAMAQGADSFAQAMEKATGQLISQMAQTWAKYFFGMALADVVTPGKQAQAAGEFAAAAALEVLAGLAGGLGGGTSSGSGSSSGKQAPLSITSAAAQSAANPGGSQNVPHLAEGGLVTMPTMLMAGDARSGGASKDTEAIIPLHNREAMEQIAAAISARMGNHGGVTMHVGGVISADNLTKVVQKINQQVGRRQARLTAGNAFRITRRG